ncbi:YodC family protein [Prosthecodimorpha staleyi]|uniref:DUF2158 domain-containing protein n=1 Tax=Prosthecodimorpha staleyi TaxID=2840188 RepID=A0A947D287_9HYPH|nr:DUF2158 domain-containing protein [Prosthecodimorpha staleyi]MBT9288953.1 DUF2158 domain-containing protein [Prosthecodimorpha staleyi]
MSDPLFSPGDVVSLRSGGPAMTVTKVTATEITCLWFAETDQTLRTGTVPPIALALIESDDEIEDADDEIEDDDD